MWGAEELGLWTEVSYRLAAEQRPGWPLGGQAAALRGWTRHTVNPADSGTADAIATQVPAPLTR